MKTRRVRLKSVRPSQNPAKKWDATFEYADGHTKTTSFGARGMSDYTKHKDTRRKQRYIARHRGMGETFTDPVKAQTLSRYILWNKKTLKSSIRDYKQRFNV